MIVTHFTRHGTLVIKCSIENVSDAVAERAAQVTKDCVIKMNGIEFTRRNKNINKKKKSLSGD